MFSRSFLGRITLTSDSARAASAFAVLALVAGCAGPSESSEVRHAALGSSTVVISQVFGGGGSTAPYQNDYVELFNRSQSTISIDGWSIQYGSATGTGNFSGNGIVPLTGSLAPGQHYLVQLGPAATGVALPIADASSTAINLALAAGKVVLVNNSAGLECNGSSKVCDATQLASIVDLVGYGTANYHEGSAAAPAPSATLATIRGLGGCTDTDQNGADFTAGTPAPHNKASDATPCSTANVAPSVSAVSPANNALNVAPEANLALTFSESVTPTGSWFTLACTTSGAVAATVSGGPTVYTLDPSVTLANNETCTLTVIAADVTDADGLAMASNFVSTFTTIAIDGLTPIHTIQGASHISPLNGGKVTTRGIVTAVSSLGYYLQDPTPDSNDATSEAIFVFTGSAPPVQTGDDVQVSGTVDEFRSGCSNCAASSSAFANLTNTEIELVTAQTVLSHSNALPAATVLGNGGRAIPNATIKDNANGDVEIVANVFAPATQGLDFYESLEDMRVQVNDAVVVGPTASFTGGSLELPVLADNGANAGLRTSRGGIIVSASDFNPERITLANDLLPALPSANVGDTLPGAIVGIMSYTFANPKLFETQALPALVKSGVTQEVTTLPARRAVDLDIAAFNVENLDPTDPASKFSQLAGILVNNLKAPDIVALEEIQDNNGATDDGVVSATTTLNQLVAAVTTAGGPSYAYRSIDPVNDEDGGEPGGNIRVAFLYRTDRGLTFVDHAGATSTTANSVVSGANGVELQYSPGRIDPTNSAFANSRKPLAGQFAFQGQTLFVIANHFNSKGGDNPLFGRFQPPVLSSEAQRLNQAAVVKTFVGQLLAADAKAQLVVLGDLNDFEFSPPVSVLKSAGLSTLVERLPANERYTYVYQGNSQVLDQVLVSSAANEHVVGYDVVHVNAEFAVQASDHDPGVARLSFDHTAPTLTGPATNPSVVATSAAGANVSFTVTANDPEDGSLPVTCVPPSDSVFAIGTTAVSCSATDANGNTGHLDFSVIVTAASGSGGSGGGGAGGAGGAGGTIGIGGIGGAGGTSGSSGSIGAGGTSGSGGAIGSGGTGGASAGGASSGGAGTAGASSGGNAGNSGSATGGNAGNSSAGGAVGGNAGTSSAGAGTGGSGGTSAGGAANGGHAGVSSAGTGGSATGGAATAGEAGESIGGEASAGEAGSAQTSAGSAGDASSGTDNAGTAGETSSTPPVKHAPGDDGCSCSTVPASHSQSPVLVGFGLVLLGLARRRRQGAAS